MVTDIENLESLIITYRSKCEDNTKLCLFKGLVLTKMGCSKL